MNGDPGDIHPAALKMDEEQNVGGHQPTQRQHLGREEVGPVDCESTTSRSTDSSRTGRALALGAGDCLHLEEVLHAVLAPLATVAGLLVATERGGALVRHAVEVDVAGADLLADALGACDGTG